MAGKIIAESSCSLKEFRLLTGKTDVGNVMSKVNLRTKLCRQGKDHIYMSIPLISAAMQAVSGVEMAVALAQMGGLSVIPCSIPISEQVKIIKAVKRAKAGFQEDVLCLKEEDKISLLMKLNQEKGYGKFPVTDDGTSSGKFLGMITTKNFDFRVHSQDTVKEHMVKVATADAGINLGDANREMIKHGTDVMPVLDKKGNLTSIVFKKDVEQRFSFPDSATDELKRYMVAGGVSTQLGDKKRIDALLEAGADIIFIDASDGFSQFQVDTIKYIREQSDIPVVGGNVITAVGFKMLAEAGFDAVKVGMGIGSGCTTQEQKGTGRGQATALIDVCSARDDLHSKTGKYLPIISDGSIANAGQIMVALALGADSVMMGRFFAQFTESAGSLRQHPSLGPVKEYWMEASARARSYGRYDGSKDTFFEEGVEGYVPHRGSIYVHLRETLLKMKSSMSSCGCGDMEEFHEKAIVERQSQVALLDAGVHDLMTK